MKKLPCPRLELRWRKVADSWVNRECVYSLVIPLCEHDIRRENEDGDCIKDELFLEIGFTQVNGGRGGEPIYSDGIVETPYRDGAHAQFDNKALGGNIPIVAICGDKFTIIDKY